MIAHRFDRFNLGRSTSAGFRPLRPTCGQFDIDQGRSAPRRRTTRCRPWPPCSPAPSAIELNPFVRLGIQQRLLLHGRCSFARCLAIKGATIDDCARTLGGRANVNDDREVVCRRHGQLQARHVAHRNRFVERRREGAAGHPAHRCASPERIAYPSRGTRLAAETSIGPSARGQPSAVPRSLQQARRGPESRALLEVDGIAQASAMERIDRFVQLVAIQRQCRPSSRSVFAATLSPAPMPPEWSPWRR